MEKTKAVRHIPKTRAEYDSEVLNGTLYVPIFADECSSRSGSMFCQLPAVKTTGLIT